MLSHGLNAAQSEAVNCLDGPVLILAGAGTGKTRTVTCRIAHMLDIGIPPSEILAVTFTNKAAEEMRERIGNMVGKNKAQTMTIATFHSLCVRILRMGIDRLGYKNNFSIYSDRDQKALLSRLIVNQGGITEGVKPAEIIAAISAAKNKGIALSDMEDDFFASVGVAYQNALIAQNAVDFDDLLLLSQKLLKEHPDVARECQQRWTRVTVDEFQDTNELQMLLLKHLVKAPYHICVVGDDDQSIYGWRGAQITNILHFETFFPHPKVILLEENYRSTNAIIHTANSLITNNKNRREKKLRATKPTGKLVKIVKLPDDERESSYIADQIDDLSKVERIPLENIAILFRTNTQTLPLERALRNNNIPYRMVGAKSFYDKREISEMLAYLHVAENSRADIPLLRILNTPPRGISNLTATLLTQTSSQRGGPLIESLALPPQELNPKAQEACQTFIQLIEQLREKLVTKHLRMGETMREFCQTIDYFDYVKRSSKNTEESDRRLSALDTFLEELNDASDDGLSLKEFLNKISLHREREENKDIEKKKGVTLITLHASKGLEFPVVYLVGLEEGILPHMRSIEEGTVDEERRLFYVGITRAQERCTITWCAGRKKWKKIEGRLPSPFLSELSDSHIEHFDYQKDYLDQPVDDDEMDALFAAFR